MPDEGVSGAPVVTDGVVRLRAPRVDDIVGLQEMYADPLTRRWIRSAEPYGADEARAWVTQALDDWASRADVSPRQWVVEHVQPDGTARFAGTREYRPDGRGSAETGGVLHPDARGRGLARRAVALARDHAFDQDGMSLLRSRVMTGNFASLRVVWSAGLRLDGTARGWIIGPDGSPRDSWLSSMHRDDPRRPAHPWFRPDTVTGARVRLRPWREDDRERVVLDALAREFVGPVLPPHDPAGFAGWLQRARLQMACGQAVTWCLADPVTDAPGGYLAIFGLNQPFQHGSGTIGYWLSPDARGRGVLAEALDLARAFAFAPAAADPFAATTGLGLHRLEAATDVRNIASSAALVRASWRWTGSELQSTVYLPGGISEDTARFELLATGAERSWLSPGLRRPPVLSAERVTLSPPDEADLPAMALMLREPDIGPRYDPEADVAQASAWWTHIRHRQWAGRSQLWLIRTEPAGAGPADGGPAGAPVGWVTAYGQGLPSPGEAPGAAIGYWVHPDHRGRGRSHEAVDLVLTHLLAPVSEGGAGCPVVRADTTRDNLASQRVLLRAGLRQVGSVGTRLMYQVGAQEDRLASAHAYAAARIDVPVLEGDQVRLRPWQASDIPRVTQACADPVAQLFLPDLPRSYTRSEAATYLQLMATGALSGALVGWCVADKTDDRCLGALDAVGPRRGAATG